MSKTSIILKSFDIHRLDNATGAIVTAILQSGASVAGPIPLPTRIERFTVNRASHIDKKSREQFEIREHKRLIVLEGNVSAQTMDALRKLNIGAAVELMIITGSQADTAA